MSESQSSQDRRLSDSDESAAPAKSHPDPLVSGQLPETVPARELPGDTGQPLDEFNESHWRAALDPPQREESAGRIGHYEILSVVGHGGMGYVLKAFDERLHRIVAVKLMSGKLLSSDNARQRFIREARSAASINHPNVVTVHAVDEQRGLPYLVMEFVEGKTLQERIERDAPLELLDVLRISEQICAGLTAAHRRDIVHRDIKPGNVMLEDGIDRVKITDFGLARLLVEHSDLTSMDDMIGTPAFMSPEQVGGGDIDVRSDLFSLGSVMYALIAGRSPFRGNSAVGTANSVKNEPHPPLQASHPETPQYLVEVIDQLLRKDPKDRIQSAEAVAQRLRPHYAEVSRQRIGGGRATDALPAPSARPPHSRLWWASTAFVLAIVGLFLGRDYLTSPSEEPNTNSASAPATTPPAGASTASTARETEPRQPRFWRVATDAEKGPVDFSDLQAAIDAAGPGDVIQVLDSAEYQGPFVIADAQRLAGLQMSAVQTAVLTSTSSEPVVTINGTPHVRIEGFRIRPAAEAHGLVLQSEIPGGFFRRLVFEPPEGTTRSCVLLTDGCRGTPDELLIVRECRFVQSTHSGIRVEGDVSTDYPISHVLIDGHYFTGSGRHLSLNGCVQELRFEHNVLFGGRGVSVHLDGTLPSSGIAICQNTFFRMESWLEFTDTRRDYAGIACNNLILETPDDAPLANLLQWSTPWEMYNNYWERTSPLSSAIPVGMIETVADAGVRERTPGTPNFLKPVENELAANAGSGDPFSSYVGAMAPYAQRSDASIE